MLAELQKGRLLMSNIRTANNDDKNKLYKYRESWRKKILFLVLFRFSCKYGSFGWLMCVLCWSFLIDTRHSEREWNDNNDNNNNWIEFM